MKPEEKELEKLLEEIRAKELRARKRATLYTVIPVLVAVVVFSVLAWQAIKLEHRKDATVKELADLQSRAEELRAEAENLQSRLENARANLAETRRALDELEEAAKVAEVKLSKGNDGKAAGELNAALLRVGTVGGGRWVVIGGDKSLDEAQFEAQKAKKLGYARVEIYLRQKSYRTLIEFPSEAEAKAKLSDIHTRLSADAYLRDVSKWCPHPQERGGYFSCAD